MDALSAAIEFGKKVADAISKAIREGKDHAQAMDELAASVNRGEIVSDDVYSKLKSYHEKAKAFETGR